MSASEHEAGAASVTGAFTAVLNWIRLALCDDQKVATWVASACRPDVAGSG